MNEVAVRRARLVLGWVTVSGSTPGAGNLSQSNQPPRSTQCWLHLQCCHLSYIIAWPYKACTDGIFLCVSAMFTLFVLLVIIVGVFSVIELSVAADSTDMSLVLF